MPRLTVKLDHVATVRQACRGAEPDPVQAAVLAELGGADGIAVHLRADRRHVQDRDVETLRQTVQTRFGLELAATQEMLHMALAVKPQRVTFVPERREEPAVQGGIDVVLNASQLRPFVKTLQEAGIAVGLLVEADLEQVKQAHKLDVRAVELDTAAWAEAGDARGREAALRRITDAARLARKLGLEVHAGRGLGYRNVAPLAALAEIDELAIGDAVVGRAVLVGMERAVREMIAALRAARAERV
jgi:pyridoxine 5-phosphate synthase